MFRLQRNTTTFVRAILINEDFLYGKVNVQEKNNDTNYEFVNLKNLPNPKNHTNFLDCNPKYIYEFLD